MTQPFEIAFEGTLEELQEQFHGLGWTDGLPVIPPTEAAVDRFLRFTDLDPGHVLGTVRPSRADVTVHSVAVNGVMAGCRPEYMPILIAVARVLASPEFGTKDSGSTPGWEPLVIISGPLIDELEFNYLAGVMRIGRQANATVGRFGRLFMRNVCELRIPPGATDKGTIGMNFHVALPENERAVRDLGWPTFAEDHGFAADETVVTVVGVINVTPPIYSQGSDPTVHLDAMAKILGAGSCAPFLIGAVLFPPYWHPLIVMSPLIAGLIARGGYDKPQMRQYLHEHARISPREFEEYLFWMSGNHDYGHFEGESLEWLRQYVPDFEASVAARTYSDERTVPTMPWADRIEIVVAGDPGRNQSRGYVTSHKFGAPVSRAVELPAEWPALFAEAIASRAPLRAD
jgi:hypothetical protein